MSKAFTKEDDVFDQPVLPPLVSPLPPGAKNYLTAGGAQRLRDELKQLTASARAPLVAAPAENTDAKRELQVIDQRIQYLQESLRTAEIAQPPAVNDGVVRFGATVTVRDAKGVESTYRIVGVDETDLDRDWVSWLSPIARVLLTASVGQRVPFKFPRGATELEIVRVTYA